jgi:hypothetical protein
MSGPGIHELMSRHGPSRLSRRLLGISAIEGLTEPPNNIGNP